MFAAEMMKNIVEFHVMLNEKRLVRWIMSCTMLVLMKASG